MNWCQSKKWLQSRWPIADAAALAVFLEASAIKAGNVTPMTAFSDMDHSDFLVSGLAIRTVVEKASDLGVGQLVLESIRRLREQMTINTTLGTILLLAPLAKAMAQHLERDASLDLSASVAAVLNGLTENDARDVYEAIRLAKPGGLGRASEHDVHDAPPADLVGAMQTAAAVDAVARQYTNGFADVLRMTGWMQRGLVRGLNLADLIVEVQLRWMAEELDGLIVRKAGHEVAEEARQLAVWALDERLETGQCGTRWVAFDTFLRSGDRTRNPGTTADLIAAALFVLLVSR